MKQTLNKILELSRWNECDYRSGTSAFEATKEANRIYLGSTGSEEHAFFLGAQFQNWRLLKIISAQNKVIEGMSEALAGILYFKPDKAKNYFSADLQYCDNAEKLSAKALAQAETELKKITEGV